jgi:hypothetical protein
MKWGTAVTSKNLSSFNESSFLGAFAQLRKANVSFVMFVRPLETASPTGRIFMNFDI